MLTDGRFDLVVPDRAELGVVVLHPHPDYGGDRFNPVVDAIFRAVTAAGTAAVRFDFSSSDVAMAADETRDALARLPGDVPIAMAGYSFGAGIATQVLDDRITRWVLVAPPLTSLALDLDAIASDPRPKHLLAPVHDQFCPPSDRAGRHRPVGGDHGRADRRRRPLPGRRHHARRGPNPRPSSVRADAC